MFFFCIVKNTARHVCNFESQDRTFKRVCSEIKDGDDKGKYYCRKMTGE